MDQKLRLEKLPWDKAVPPNIHTRSVRFRGDLHILNDPRIPRNFTVYCRVKFGTKDCLQLYLVFDIDFFIHICFSTKVIGLEIATDLTKNAFIEAFRRFCTGRDKLSKLLLDNGEFRRY